MASSWCAAGCDGRHCASGNFKTRTVAWRSGHNTTRFVPVYRRLPMSLPHISGMHFSLCMHTRQLSLTQAGPLLMLSTQPDKQITLSNTAARYGVLHVVHSTSIRCTTSLAPSPLSLHFEKTRSKWACSSLIRSFQRASVAATVHFCKKTDPVVSASAVFACTPRAAPAAVGTLHRRILAGRQ